MRKKHLKEEKDKAHKLNYMSGWVKVEDSWDDMIADAIWDYNIGFAFERIWMH